jgi:hypothetical protein
MKMTIEPTTTFDTISKRVIYGLNLIYSEFAPVNSKNSSEKNQKRLHELMGLMIDKLYENPELLKLTSHKDEAYQLYEVNNMKPELDKVFQSVTKELFEFYKFLYITALHGEINVNSLFIGNAVLKGKKSDFKPQYKELLNSVEIEVAKDKTAISIIADNELLQSFKLLAEKVPVNINKWTPFVLANFACCSFTNDFSYLLKRTDDVNGLNGLLFELQEQCLKEGYKISFECYLNATGLGYNIQFRNKVGGFLINYLVRKYQQFTFGTLNGIGEKAMLEDFENIDKDLQNHFVSVCKICNDCLGCTKGGKNKVFTVKVTYDGKERKLCPSFPKHNWNTIDHRLIEVLSKYHVAQERYGINRKNN